MGLLSKVDRAVKQPEKRDYFVRTRVNKAVLLARRGRYGALLNVIVTGITGRNFYDLYLALLRRAVPGGLIVVDVDGNDLIVDLSDPGISRDLFLYGTREEKPARIFERELRRIATTESEVVCLDVGANIGYYTIRQARSINSGEVHAIEPVEENLSLLTKNVRLNGFHDNVVIERCAIGSETGTKRLHLSSHSNLHQIGDRHNRPTLPSDASIDVPVYSLDDYVERKGLEFEDVNAVRMDLEGYETEVVRGMTSVLEAPGPTLLYLEVHNHFLERDELATMLETLRTAGFDIVAVEYDVITAEPLDLTHEVRSWEDLEEIDHDAYSLILKKE